MIDDPLARWHDVVARRDAQGLEALLAPDAVFQSPAVHRPQEGRALVLKYLRAALRVLNTEDFRYVGQWRDARSCVLEFETRLGDVHVNGVDIIGWDADGLIASFKVMVRPMKALNTVIPLMAAILQAEDA